VSDKISDVGGVHLCNRRRVSVLAKLRSPKGKRGARYIFALIDFSYQMYDVGKDSVGDVRRVTRLGSVLNLVVGF